MEKFIIPKDYHSELNLHDTQIAIKTVKDFFQNLLSQRLNLSRVSAPLFVDPDSGLNDNLNGVERPVTFDIKEQNGREAEVVQSLAKWKRYALKKYGFSYGEGLYTDMNAIRRDEITDNIHSIFVDQWDWEKIIKKDERTIATLMDTVKVVYKCLRKTEKYMAIQYDYIEEILPHDIFFITTQELEDMFSFAFAQEGPVAIRYSRGAAYDGLSDHREAIRVGRSEWIHTGRDIAVIAVGSMVEVAVHAVEMLQQKGLDPTLINARFVKPMDEQMLKQVAAQHSIVVTMEDGVITGGFGQAVAAWYAATERGEKCPKIVNIALPDAFIEHGTVQQLRSKYGQDAESVAARIEQVWRQQ